MKLLLENGLLYVDNVKHCKYEVQHGTAIQPGIYATEVRYAHAFGCNLPHVTDLGWLGTDRGVSIVLGRVRASSGLIPDGHIVRVLIAAIDAAFDAGESVLTEVK